jgi:hypothetical protein
MPALSNPRHERFAQAIFAGLSGETRIARAQSTAYLKAYPNCSNGNSAEAAASRLLRRVKSILERVRELQAEQNKRLEPKLDLSKERVGRRLDKASRIAEHQGNAAAMATSELGIAKVFGLIGASDDYNPTDYSNAKSPQDLGRMLLQSVGLNAPSTAEIAKAVALNDAFVDGLERLKDMAIIARGGNVSSNHH